MQVVTPKVSVIIPVYNVENYLSECLDSVINQSLKELEILCINDGSTDNSIEILSKYAKQDSRIKIITKKNSGLACTRNTGIENTTGEYIFFLDSDDYLVPNVLEKLYKDAINYQTDIIVSKCKPFAEKGAFDEYTLKRVEELNKYLNYNGDNNVNITTKNFREIIDNYPCVSCGSLYKTDFLKQNNLKFINQKVIHEDNGFFLKVLSTFPKITFLNVDSIMYRVRSNSISFESCKRENKTVRFNQLKIVLIDAFNYIKKYNPTNAKYLISAIKTSNTYCPYTSTIIKGIYTHIWGVDNKRIKLLGFPIYRDKLCNGKRVIKLFGIPINIKKG